MNVKMLSVCMLGVVLAGPALADAAMPGVAEPYLKSFQGAWEKSSEGDLPVYECTHIAGLAAKHVAEKATAAAARQAYKACYVDAALRYSEAFFKLHSNAVITDDGKPLGCQMYSRYIKGHVVALESYLDKIGFTAAELNAEIGQKLDTVSASCEVDLNS